MDRTKENNNIKEFYGKHLIYMQKVLAHACDIARKISSLSGDKKAKIISRIKSAESMSNKIKKDGFKLDYDSIFIKEGDAIGIRIITNTISDVYEIVNNIQANAREYTVVNIKDYIKKPKSSGYRSVHMILGFPSMDKEYPIMKVEFQIRTAIMDCWASLEHILKYKQIVDLTPEMYDLLDTYRSEVNKEIMECHKVKCI